MFVCPFSEADYPAEIDNKGKFKLSERTCSYAYSKVPLKPPSEEEKEHVSDMLAADKQIKGQHEYGLNIVFAGGGVYWVRPHREKDTWEKLTKNQLTGCPTYKSNFYLWFFISCLIVLGILIPFAVIKYKFRKNKPDKFPDSV